MEFIFDLAKIAGGLILAQSLFANWNKVYDDVQRASNWLAGFQGLIGGFSFILGIIFLIKPGCLLMDISGILLGLILFGVSLSNLPVVGESLHKASKSLNAFAYPIGIAALISGVLGLFNLLCI